MAILPKHLLEGEDMQESDFFRHPIGTGPYKLDNWDAGQAITLVKNEDYFKGAPNIDKIIFKIVPDDNAKAIQMQSGELDLALLTPKDAKTFADQDGYTCYDMKTRITAESFTISIMITGQQIKTLFLRSIMQLTDRRSLMRFSSDRE